MRLVDEANTFVPSLLSRMFLDPGTGPGFDVLVAVIDKIPLHPDVYSNSKLARFHGSEGISVSTFESKMAAPDLWSPRDRPTDRQTKTIQQRCTLSFQFEPVQRMGEGSLENDSDSYTNHLLELPVANTLFLNGQTSTLFAEHWAFSNDSKSSSGFVRTKQVSLPQQTLRVTSSTQEYGGRHKISSNRAGSPYKLTLFEDISGLPPYDNKYLYNRLKPITPFRIVAAAVGNIIRTFHSGSESVLDKTIPASRELELALSKYIETGQNSAEKVEVWAMVKPGENGRSTPRILRSRAGDILKDITCGVRLHKVLSGGGGWGVKEGLLALDPDSDFSDGNGMQLDFEDGQNTTLRKFQGFGELVKSGDQVQFLILRPPISVKVPKDHFPYFITSPSVCLGTVPAKMDVVPNQSVGFGQSDPPADFAFFHNHFGMFTEHGMTLKVETHPSNDSRHSGAPQVGSIMQTKLDAPDTCFCAMTGLQINLRFMTDDDFSYMDNSNVVVHVFDGLPVRQTWKVNPVRKRFDKCLRASNAMRLHLQGHLQHEKRSKGEPT